MPTPVLSGSNFGELAELSCGIDGGPIVEVRRDKGGEIVRGGFETETRFRSELGIELISGAIVRNKM